MSPEMPTPRMIMNPNLELVQRITARINKCGGRCPCQPMDDDKDTRCPCPDFYKGECHCKLFIPEE